VTGFYGSNDPTNSVKALKEVVVLRIRLQSHQVHLTVLRYYACMQYTDRHTEMCTPVRDSDSTRVAIFGLATCL